ncbi:Phospho-N-acetylmuramoyl-pentapeptide-transferase [uncultured archaeon]|nr:Phospho-N-acetylmuramoyl-pentapeptide-transferase [uncultured archaeon]
MAYTTFLTLIVPAIIAFIITAIATEFVMGYMYSSGVVAEDHNKETSNRRKPKILPSSGGIAVVFGLITGMLTYAFGGSIGAFSPVLNISDLLAVALSITLIALVGFLDDINVKSKRIMATGIKDIKQGLKKWQKPLLTVVGALPLMAINAGVSTITVPFLGPVDFGLLYPVLILPLAVIFVSNAFNLLGGFDGLQPGMAMIASLGFIAYFIIFQPNIYIGALLSALMFASLVAFLPFNKYPARIIPGDSFTYAIGAILVAIMVMGNAEAFGMIVFAPWVIEFFLHLRRKFDVRDLGIRQKDGTLAAPYGKSIYSLTHLVMNMGRMREKQVTLYLCLMETGFVILGLLLKALGFL